MKGSNKQFARYLHSEYYDDSLEPLDIHRDPYGLNISKQQQISAFKNKTEPLYPQKKVIEKPAPRIENIRLSLFLVQNLAMKLSEDVQSCVNNVRMVKFVQYNQVLETYKEFYAKFQTIPILFCSIVPNEAIYIWQVNKLCPLKTKSNFIVVDSRTLTSDLCEQVSLLMLAKIKQEEDEEIIDVKFLGNTQLIIKSKVGEKQFVIKQYNISDFYDIATVNPFRQKVLANKLYSYKLLIQGFENAEESSNNLEVTLWKAKTTEQINTELKANPDSELEKDTLIGRRVLSGLPIAFKAHVLDFSDFHRGLYDINLVIDKDSATVIAWKGVDFTVSRLDTGLIRSIKQYSGYLYLNNLQSIDYKIDLEDFPDLGISEENILFCEDASANDTLERTIMNWFVHRVMVEKRLDFMEMVYDYSVKLVNPQMPRNNDNKFHYQQGEDEQEKNILKKISQKKRELKQTRHEDTRLKDQKEILAELRDYIQLCIVGIVEYNEAYEDYITIQHPKRVSREIFNLYEQIRREKKRVIKEKSRDNTVNLRRLVEQKKWEIQSL